MSLKRCWITILCWFGLFRRKISMWCRLCNVHGSVHSFYSMGERPWTDRSVKCAGYYFVCCALTFKHFKSYKNSIWHYVTCASYSNNLTNPKEFWTLHNFQSVILGDIFVQILIKLCAFHVIQSATFKRVRN